MKATRPTDTNGLPIITLGDRLAAEARRARGRYTGSLLDLARYTAQALSPATIAAMRAEVDALDAELQRVRLALK